MIKVQLPNGDYALGDLTTGSSGYYRFQTLRMTAEGWVSCELRVRRCDDKNPNASLQISIEQHTMTRNRVGSAKPETHRTNAVLFSLPHQLADAFVAAASFQKGGQ